MSTQAPPAPFGRLLTAMATAFDADGDVDPDATARIAAYLIDHGHDGVVVSGTTGESPTLSKADHAEAVRAVKDAIGDRACVVVGVGTNATAHSVELALQAEKLDADGLLLVAPYYNKPSPGGLQQHFRQVVAATDVPVMLYDVPARTATRIDQSTYELAAEWDTVTAVKVATGDIPGAARIAQLGLAVYSGDDAATLGYLAYGGCGLVSVAGHAVGRPLKAMIEAFLRGDHAEALRTHESIAGVIEAMMAVENYGATTAKAALELLGVLDNRRVRAPLLELDESEVAALRTALAAANLLSPHQEDTT